MHSIPSSDLSAEPSTIRRLSPEQKDRLTEILDRYLSGLESGVPAAREELLAAHPDLAETLEKYLRSLDELHDVAAGFGGPARQSDAEADSPASDEKRLGDFRILREIGRGGMGIVYKARQVSANRTVAVKVIRKDRLLHEESVARFRREAQAASRLDHPNVVSVRQANGRVVIHRIERHRFLERRLQ